MDVFDLYAKLSLDSRDYDRALSSASSAAEQWKTKMVIAAKAVGSAFSGATALLVGVVKQAVAVYGEYEQQVGGIETLFGAGGKSLEEYAASVGKTVDEVKAEYAGLMEAQGAVMQNAHDAWLNQGLSANEYMSLVTSFAAALKQSTADSNEAAEVANMAMTDMADNANKFGTDMASIQNAYQGFAKQNYTMLDNLKLGYGGTRSEMERLLADAEKLTGIKYDINQLDDVYSAIHVIQEELGVAGTTAEEAMHTIQGSASALRSAWQNTLIAMSSGEGIDAAIENLATSFGTLADNLLPVIQTAIESAAQMLEQLAPKIAEMLPGLVESVIPPLMSAVTSLVTSIAQMLGDSNIINSIVQAGVTLFSSLLDNLPAILSALGIGVVNLVTGLADAIGEQFPVIQQAFGELFAGIEELGVFDALTAAFESVKETVAEVVNTITSVFDSIINSPAMAIVKEAIGETFSGLVEQIGPFMDLIGSYFEIIINNITTIVGALGTVWNYVSPLVAGVIALIDDLVAAVIGIGNTVMNIVKSVLQVLEQSFNLIVGLFTGNEAKVQDSLSNIKTIISKAFTEAYNSVVDIILDLWNGVQDAFGKIKTAIEETFDIDLAETGRKIVESLKKGIEDKWQSFLSVIEGKINDLLDILPDWFKELFNIGGSVTLTQANFSKYMSDEQKRALGYSARPDQSMDRTGKPKTTTSSAKSTTVDLAPKSIEDIEELTTAQTDEESDYLSEFADTVEKLFKDSEETNEKAITGLNNDMNDGFNSVTGGIGSGANTEYSALDQYKEMQQAWSTNTDENGNWIADWSSGGMGEQMRDFIHGKLPGTYWGDLTNEDMSKLAAMPASADYTKGMYLNQPQSAVQQSAVITPAATSLMAGENSLPTLDVASLMQIAQTPVSEEVIASWQELADAITAVLNAINGAVAGEGAAAASTGAAASAGASGGSSVSGEGAEGGGSGLAAAFSAVKAVMSELIGVAASLGAELGTNLVTAVTMLTNALCVISVGEDGSTSANGGNTLYNSLGAIFGVLSDILTTSRNLAEHWTGEFISAIETMKKACGRAEGVVQSLGNSAGSAADQFNAMADAIWAVIEALEALNSMGGGSSALAGALSNSQTNSGDRGIHDLFYASGGHVTGGRTIVVGEEGPELFTPSRSGYIIPNDELMSGSGSGTVINVTFSGDVIGDERSISAYVTRAVKAGIRQEVMYG